MAESGIKNYISERRNRIYEHPAYQNLSQYILYNPDYEKKDPRKYIYLHSREYNTLQPIRISKSISIFLENQTLQKMDQIARKLNYIIVPAKIFHWRRREKFKTDYPSFFASSNIYIMLPESKLNKNERYKFIDHLRTLDWHYI